MHLIDVVLPAVRAHLGVADDAVRGIALDLVFGVEVDDERPGMPSDADDQHEVGPESEGVGCEPLVVPRELLVVVQGGGNREGPGYEEHHSVLPAPHRDRPLVIHGDQGRVGSVLGHAPEASEQAGVAPVLVDLVDPAPAPLQEAFVVVAEEDVHAEDAVHGEHVGVSRSSFEDGGFGRDAGQVAHILEPSVLRYAVDLPLHLAEPPGDVVGASALVLGEEVDHALDREQDVLDQSVLGGVEGDAGPVLVYGDGGVAAGYRAALGEDQVVRGDHPEEVGRVDASGQARRHGMGEVLQLAVPAVPDASVRAD